MKNTYETPVAEIVNFVSLQAIARFDDADRNRGWATRAPEGGSAGGNSVTPGVDDDPR